MKQDNICPSCAFPVEIPSGYEGIFLVCANCGVPLENTQDNRLEEHFYNE